MIFFKNQQGTIIQSIVLKPLDFTGMQAIKGGARGTDGATDRGGGTI